MNPVILVTGSDTPAGQAIVSRLGQLNLATQSLTVAECEQSGDRLRKQLKGLLPVTFIVHAFEQGDWAKAEAFPDISYQLNVRFTEVLADVAQEAGIPVMMLSSYLVFSGAKKNPYIAANPTGALSRYGQDKVEAERALQERVRRHVILRTGWLMDQSPQGWLSRCVEAAVEGLPLLGAPAMLINPTSVEHLAQVVAAMLQQLHCGMDDVWGVYHYGDSEPITHAAFMEAVGKSLAGFVPGFSPVVEYLDHEASPVPGVTLPVNGSLSCIKLRNTFGIKQRAWRVALPRMVSSLVACAQQEPLCETLGAPGSG